MGYKKNRMGHRPILRNQPRANKFARATRRTSRSLFLIGCLVLSAMPAAVRAESVNLKAFELPCEGVFEFPSGTTAAPELSAALCEMVESGKVVLLDQLAGSCQIMLLEQAGELDLRVKFYFGQAQLNEIERFEGLLERCATYLELLEESVERLGAFMEWYPVGQWDQRFGRNGFYRQVMWLKRQAEVLRAVYHYYVAAVGISAGRETKGLVQELEKAVQLLSQGTIEAERGSEVELRLWPLKVKLLLAQLEPQHLERIGPMIKALLKKSLNDEQLWSLRLVTLEHTYLLTKKNAGKVKRQIQKMRNWLEAHQGVAERAAQKQLELSLYEGTLERQRFLSRKKKGGGNEINVVLDRQLAPLKRLAKDDPKLRGAIELLIATQVEPFFSGQNPDGLTRKWDAFELMSLKRYYQAKETVDLDQILAVCDTFLTTVSPDDASYPEMLYQKGLGHYQKMRAQEKARADEAIEEKVRACQTWQQLAQDYPNWSHSPGVSAERAGAIAANMAYNLFVAYPETYGVLAEQVLATVAGPLAQSREAKEYRYHYGLVLMADGDYRAAATMFRTVGKEDKHYGQACYQAAQCYVRLYPSETHREQLVRVLTSLVETIDPEGDDRDLLQVVLTLAGLRMNGTEADMKAVVDLLDYFDAYWKGLAKDEAVYRTVIFVRVVVLKQLGRMQQALEELRPVLQANPTGSKFWDVGLGLMQDFQGPFLAQHGRGQYDILIPSLEVALPVSALLYDKVRKGDDVRRAVMAGRFYLEQLTLWLLGPSNEETKRIIRLKVAKEIVEKLDKQAGVNQQLWFVRCRALLAYAQGDFAQSQLYWYRIRQSSSPQGRGRDTWWEARYFGLMCLYQQEGAGAVEGLIEQVLGQYSWLESDWIDRLEQFKEGLGVKK